MVHSFNYYERIKQSIHEKILECLMYEDTVIISSQVSHYVEEQLKRKGFYKCSNSVPYSYGYIEKFYGSLPIFGFILHREDYNKEQLDLIFSNIPKPEGAKLYFLKYNKGNEIMQGSYWEWCNFHFFMEDCLRAVPNKQEDLFTMSTPIFNMQAFKDLDIPKQLVIEWSNKDGFESHILINDSNYPNQIMFKEISKDNIITQLDFRE